MTKTGTDRTWAMLGGPPRTSRAAITTRLPVTWAVKSLPRLKYPITSTVPAMTLMMPAVVTLRMRLPLTVMMRTVTSRFSYFFISLTTPACDDGISIDALSLSTVTSDCSALMLSPGLTSSSITDTSATSPMSGTFTSTRLIWRLSFLS